MAGFAAQRTARPRISTGCDALDHLLPGNGLQPGMLIEWLTEGRGSGAGTLAMHVARRVIDEQPGAIVVTDRWRHFYPPGARALGVDWTDLIVVRSEKNNLLSREEELWAIDQALRCQGVSVVVAWIDAIEARAFRRLQLAAEAGGTCALLLRPHQVQAQPTWSDVQLLVSPCPSKGQTEKRYCHVTLLRQRGRMGSEALEGVRIELAMDEWGLEESTRNESHSLPRAARLAHSATRRRSARA